MGYRSLLKFRVCKMKETTHRGWYILEQRERRIVAFPRV